MFQVYLREKATTFALIYRPPNANLKTFFSFFNVLCQSLLQTDDIVLAGDFNLPKNQLVECDSDWHSLLKMFDLTQLVTESTHESGSILDFIIVRRENENFVTSMQVVEGLADHKGVCFNYNGVQQTKLPVNKTNGKVRNFKSISIDDFSLDLLDNVVSPLLEKYADPNNIWLPLPSSQSHDFVDEFESLLSSSLDKFAPFTELKPRKKTGNKWWNRRCQEKKKEVRKFEKRWRCSPITINRQMYIGVRQEYQKILAQERARYISHEINKCENDAKKHWRLINSLLGRSRMAIFPDLPASSMADQFNKFFKEKIEKIRESIVKRPNVNLDHNYQVSQNLQEFQPVTGSHVVQILRSMRLKHNSLDLLPSWLLKKTSSVLLPVIVCLVNCILVQGMPAKYKHSIITPLLKGKSLDQNELKNYRPVANFPTIVKIIENVIADQMMSHLTRNVLLDQHQYAYKPHHSCETAVLSTLNDIYMAADRKEISIAVLLDMSAAFDTVDHGLLLKKLEVMGITDKALEWMMVYLNDRIFSTIACGVKSKPLPLQMGVPQGSVLGPLLFTVYIRDLGEIIQRTDVKYSIYADDVQLLVHSLPSKFTEGVKRIEETLSNIEDYTSNNFLQLNSMKTEFIAFGTKEQIKKIPSQVISVNGNEFALKSTVRNLGVLMDSNLKFNQQVNTICRTAYSHLRSLHRLRNSLTNGQMARFVSSLVLSRIDCFPAVLFGIDGVQSKKLQRVIKSSFRLTYKRKKYDKISGEMWKRGWLSVDQRITLRLLIIIWTTLKTGLPKYLFSLLSTSTNAHTLNLRSQSRGELIAQSSSTTIGKRSFMVAAPSLWRSIPTEIRMKKDKGSFRTAVINWLLQNDVR
jgi:hypothetical protein